MAQTPAILMCDVTLFLCGLFTLVILECLLKRHRKEQPWSLSAQFFNKTHLKPVSA